jgi:FkbM family methyltransferase
MFGSLRTLDYAFHKLDQCRQAFGPSRAFSAARSILRAEKQQRGQQTALPLSPPFWIRAGTTDLWTFEEVFFRHVYRYDVEQPSVIVDLGAHIGCATRYFAERYPDATIVAVEPSPDSFALLVRNTESYKHVHCVQAAIWGCDQVVAIADRYSNPTRISVESDGDVKVRAISLPRLLADFGLDRVDILKMDIEGSERSLFAANTEWLSKIGVLLIEIHDRMWNGCSRAVWSAVLQSPRFTMETRDGNVSAFDFR